jgi:amino acid adenylation domain-containing protein
MLYRQLSYTEKNFWVDEVIHHSCNHVLVSFVASEQVDILAVENAIKCVIDETPQFHSTVVLKDGVPYWNTEEQYHYPIKIASYVDNQVDQEIERFSTEQFDLSKDYPCKFLLLRGQHRHLLLFLFHHLVMEDSSMQLLCAKVSSFYNDLVTGRKPEVRSDKRNTFNIQSTNKEEDINYWNNYIKGIEANNIRSYFPAALAADQITMYRFSFGDLQQSLNTLCSNEKVGPFRLLAAAWAVTVMKVFQLHSVNINYPISLRPSENQDEIGAFINDQLLCVSADNNTSFRDVVSAVTNDRRQARTHQNISMLDTHVGDVIRNADSSIAFNYPLGLDNVALYLNNEHIPLYKRPLTYMPSGLQLDVETTMGYGFIYTNPTYPSFFAKVLSDSFVVILRQIVGDFDVCLNNLSLSLDEPKAPAVSSSLPIQNVSLVEVFSEIVRKYPEKTAIIFGEERITFSQLDRWSDYVAVTILQHTGNKLQSPFVGVYTHRSIHTVALLLGAWKAGYAYIPMDPVYSEERLEYVVSDSSLSLIVTDCDVPIETAVVKIDWNQADCCHEKPQPSVITDYAYMIYTSGTTGNPKGVPISQNALLSLIKSRQQLLPFDKDHVELCFGSISFDASIWDLYPVLLSGATVYFASEKERHDPKVLLQTLQKHHISCLLLPPTMLTYLPYQELPELKFLITGGDTCPQETIEQWQQTTTVVNAYGPTENTVVSTLHVFNEKTICPTNIGRALPGVDCLILDDHLRPLPDGVRGTLYLAGQQLTKGYWNRPELNKEKFISNNGLIYDSGDVVCRMPNGDLLYMGRKDSQVKIRGFRIEVTEIENTLLQHGDVRQCIVTVYRHENEKYLAAYIGSENVQLSSETLREFLAQRLPQYMIPDYWYVAPLLPVNTSGKIDCKQLQQLPLSRKRKTAVVESDTEEEIKCKSLLSKVTNIDVSHIGVNDHFVNDLGVNSLDILNLSFLLSKRGYEISPADIYQHPTIRSLVSFLQSIQLNETLTPSQKDARVCYFANHDDSRKPLLLIICGYRYYEVNYTDLHNTFKDDYSVLVLESVIETKNWYPEAVENASSLLDEYVRLLRPIIKKRPIAGITGLCIGGDLALQLAVRLHELNLCSPCVFNIDGMANRPFYQGQMGVMKGRGITPEMDEERRSFTTAFAKTIPQCFYPGSFTLFLATRFEDVEDFKKEDAEAFYPKNLENWKQAQPDMEIIYMDEVHMQLIHQPECLKQIKQTVDKKLIELNKK